MSTPPATTAAVPVSSAPTCAAASMPRARPETTTSPPWPSPAASSRASRRPLAEALRAPTTATIGRASNSAWPRRSRPAADRRSGQAPPDRTARPSTRAVRPCKSRRARRSGGSRRSAAPGARARRGAPVRQAPPGLHGPSRNGAAWRKATGPTSRCATAAASRGVLRGRARARPGLVSASAAAKCGARWPAISRRILLRWRRMISSGDERDHDRGRHRSVKNGAMTAPAAVADKGGQRRIAKHESDDQPDPRRRSARPARRVRQYAEGGRDAFAATKAEPHREHVADHGAQPRRQRRTARPNARRAPPPRSLCRDRAAGSAPPVPCCRCAKRWWRRYCPSRSGGCRLAGGAAQHQPERDRAEQIPDHGGDEDAHQRPLRQSPLRPSGGRGRVRWVERSDVPHLTPPLSDPRGGEGDEDAVGWARSRIAIRQMGCSGATFPATFHRMAFPLQ